MTYNESSPSQSSATSPPEPTEDDDPPELDVVIYEGTGPDECALFPKDVDDETLDTHWIRAKGEAFVDLDSMR